jgi:A/G-specific adenine glycosylase
VQSLAAANVDVVLRLWQGLGYYSRARNLHHTAQQVVSQHNGNFPGSYQTLLTLKGIGPYTAAAIASFACKEALPAIDGNGYRILSRVFGVDAPPDTGAGKKEFAKLAAELIPTKYPDTFNQALMDFGSLVCVPAKPLCTNCPLQSGCYASAHNAIDIFPVKSKRTAVRKRYFNYLFIRQKNSVFIRKRTEKDIWQGLYEFPLIETRKPASQKKIMASESWKTFLGNNTVKILPVSPEIKHQLSHQTLHAVFYIITLEKAPQALAASYIKIPFADLDNYSLPRLLTIFLEKLQNIQKKFIN